MKYLVLAVIIVSCIEAVGQDTSDCKFFKSIILSDSVRPFVKKILDRRVNDKSIYFYTSNKSLTCCPFSFSGKEILMSFQKDTLKIDPNFLYKDRPNVILIRYKNEGLQNIFINIFQPATGLMLWGTFNVENDKIIVKSIERGVI